MKWTKTNPVSTSSLQGNKIAHHVNDVGGVKDLLYCVVVYHLELFC